MISLLSQEGTSNAQSKTNGPAGTPGHHSHFHCDQMAKWAFKLPTSIFQAVVLSRQKTALQEACWMILHSDCGQCVLQCAAHIPQAWLPINNSLSAFHFKWWVCTRGTLALHCAEQDWKLHMPAAAIRAGCTTAGLYTLGLICFFSFGFSQSSQARRHPLVLIILKGARKDLGR